MSRFSPRCTAKPRLLRDRPPSSSPHPGPLCWAGCVFRGLRLPRLRFWLIFLSGKSRSDSVSELDRYVCPASTSIAGGAEVMGVASTAGPGPPTRFVGLVLAGRRESLSPSPPPMSMKEVCSTGKELSNGIGHHMYRSSAKGSTEPYISFGSHTVKLSRFAISPSLVV